LGALRESACPKHLRQAVVQYDTSNATPTRFQFLAGQSSFFKFHVAVNAANQMGMSLASMSVHEKVRYDENLGS
jgi:hypothetical protein